MNLSIREYDTNDALKPFVQTYWQGDFNVMKSSRFAQKVIPNGYVELIIHLSDRHCFLHKYHSWSQSPNYTLIGIYTRFYEVQFDDLVSVFGIRFKPEGVFNLFGVPTSEFTEDFVDMESVLGRSFSDFSEKIREQNDVASMIDLANQYLQKCLGRSNVNYYYLNRAAEIIRNVNGNISMDDLIEKVFISSRQLEREFMDKVGLTPKQYMRIARLNEANRKLQDLQSGSLTSLSYDTGYSDQAHFIREFKKFSGHSPARFLKGREGFIVNV